jgi:hypothetical protein
MHELGLVVLRSDVETTATTEKFRLLMALLVPTMKMS